MDGTVLVADDDRTIRTVLTQALTRAGCKVHATSSLVTLMRWVEEGKGDLVISDVIMPDGVPDKGVVLNQISLYWFEQVKDLIPNHILSTDIETLPEPFRKAKDQLEHRSMIVKKAKPLAAECIVRGYLSGSGWNEYQAKGSICGVRLPAGLTESAVGAELLQREGRAKLPSALSRLLEREAEGFHARVVQHECDHLIGRLYPTRMTDLTKLGFTRVLFPGLDASEDD